MIETKQKPITSLERQRDDWKQIAENNRRMFDEKEQELLKTQQENAALVEALRGIMEEVDDLIENGIQFPGKERMDVIFDGATVDLARAALRAAGEEEGV